MLFFLQEFRLAIAATKTWIPALFPQFSSKSAGNNTLLNPVFSSANIIRNFFRNYSEFPGKNMTPSPSPTSSPSKRSVGTTLVKSPLKNSPKKLRFGDDENSKVLAEIGQIREVIESNLDKVEPDMLFFKKMTDKAFAPMKGSKLAAGYDLQSAYKYTVPARGHCLLKTDIQIKLPHGTYGRVAPRSGLALKHKIDVGAGVIDEDYRGNVGVILFNHGDVDFEVNEGDRVAQLICEKISYPDIMEVDNLDETVRGAGGFGSTGVSVKA